MFQEMEIDPTDLKYYILIIQLLSDLVIGLEQSWKF